MYPRVHTHNHRPSCRSAHARNAQISGAVTFPIVGAEGASLTAMAISYRGQLTVPGLASHQWGPAFTVSAIAGLALRSAPFYCGFGM